MTDARQEDQDRIVGLPIKANRVGTCPVNPPTCRDLIQIGDDIQCVAGNWVHEGCVEAMEAQLAATDSQPVDEGRGAGMRPPLASSILVCGSRSWTDADRIKDTLERWWPGIVIEGGAPGADRLGREAASALGIHVATVPARWKQLRGGAGYARNHAMLLLKPDLVLAFWDGKSPGTKMMIGLAEKAGVPVEVVRS